MMKGAGACLWNKGVVGCELCEGGKIEFSDSGFPAYG